MSKAVTRSTGAPLEGFMQLPAQRQVGLLLGLALAIAVLGVAYNLGSKPAMSPVLSGLTERDTAEAMDALARNGFEYRLDPASGQLLVPAARLHEARIRLATEGLPRASSNGFESLAESSGFGTSRMVENARYHHALESELARSVMTLRGVEAARVHLAVPPPSMFLRDRAPPTASVLVNLHPGRRLDDAQVAGVVHLVASSVPGLEPESVTVVDQQGRLLTSPQGHEGLSGRDLDYVQRLEENYVRRISQLLSPVLGAEGFRAQVAADVDFTMVESTHETWDPEGQVLRSEQLSEDTNATTAMPAGIPGALTNQPPPAGVAVPGLSLPADAVGTETIAATPQSTSRRSTRNYEVDRTVSHVRQAPASLRRLSVAVVVDNRPAAAEGEAGTVPLSDEEMAHISALVREAVGFDAARGDSVNVVNASFLPGAEYEPVAPPEIWREPWVADLAKQALLALVALLALPLVLRPMLKNLSQQGARAALPLPGAAGAPALPAAAPAGALPAGGSGGPARAASAQDSLKVAQEMSREDPKRVAQVVRQWVATDGNQ